MGARREITAAVVDRYRSAGRADKGRILDELCAVTGWHRKHAVRALASHVAISPEARRQRICDGLQVGHVALAGLLPLLFDFIEDCVIL